MNAPNQLVLKREKEGSAKLAVFFVALSAALVGTYAGIGVDKVLTHHYDFWFCVILGGLGWAFRSVGGNKPVIVAATLLSCFIMLTFYQAPLLRYLILAALLFAMGVYGNGKAIVFGSADNSGQFFVGELRCRSTGDVILELLQTALEFVELFLTRHRCLRSGSAECPPRSHVCGRGSVHHQPSTGRC